MDKGSRDKQEDLGPVYEIPEYDLITLVGGAILAGAYGQVFIPPPGDVDRMEEVTREFIRNYARRMLALGANIPEIPLEIPLDRPLDIPVQDL